MQNSIGKSGIFFVALLLILAIACDQQMHSVSFGGDGTSVEPEPEPVPEPQQPAGPFDKTPRPNEEAEEMALWLSHELIAPDSMYEEIAKGLEEIRSTYGDSIPQVRMPYWNWAIPSKMTVAFTDSVAEIFRAGDYHEWDSLNHHFRAINIDTTGDYGLFRAYLTFKGLLNSLILEEIYKDNLGGIIFVDHSGYVGDLRTIYPWYVDGRMTFFFRAAWGDCPSGCMAEDVYAFQKGDSGYDYLGLYSDTLIQPKPDWLNHYISAEQWFWDYSYAYTR